MKKVFLGGTCNGSTWREELKPKLIIDYFDPIVPDWTEECKVEEVKQRETCDFILYVLTPRMESFYSVAEVVDDSNKQPERTVLCILYEDVDEGKRIVFDEQSKLSMDAVAELVRRNEVIVCTSLDSLAEYLNKQVELSNT